MHIQQKAFPKHTATTKKFLYNIKKQHTNNHRDTKHLFNHKAHYLPNATNSISATKNTAPATHHNTKLYIIYIMRLLRAALCACTPTIKKIHAMHANKAHIKPPLLSHITKSAQAQTRLKTNRTSTRTQQKKHPPHITTTSPTSPRTNYT